MDLGAYTSQVCKMVDMTDADSQATCAQFVQNWYQSIYYRFDWRDGRRRATIGVAAGVDNVPLPSGIDRVLSIRYGGDHFLDPVDDTFFVETDPTIFERTGVPQYYQEYTEDDGTKRIRLYPIPSVNNTMLVIGKKALPPLLLNSDTPIIRGIDQVIMAYALHDMLKYHRQYTKAQLQFQEAEKLFADAVALEQAQTNVPRRTKGLTVAGDSLSEMTDAVCARIGQWTPDVRIMVGEFLRRNYVQIYDAYLWPESLVMARVDGDGSQVVLPWYFSAVIAVRTDSKWPPVPATDLSLYFMITPTIFEQNTGPALAYTILTPVAVATLPPIGERLAVVSSDPSDAGNIMIRGESNGDIVIENLTLNGQSTVYTGELYQTPLTIAKDITVGNITINGASSNVLLGTLAAQERERKYMRLWIQPNSTTPQQCLILGKRAIRPLIQDQDTPAIRGLANYLIHSATSESFSKAGNTQGATDAKTKADAALQALLDREIHQNSVGTRVIPYVAPSDYESYVVDDFLHDKFYVS